MTELISPIPKFNFDNPPRFHLTTPRADVFIWLLLEPTFDFKSCNCQLINNSGVVMEREGAKLVNKTSTTNYGDIEYWDSRYSKKKDERFEWLQPYDRLKPYLEECLPRGKESRILNIGCGNSSIQEYLYEDGYHNIVGNDISAVVIQQMKQSQHEKGYGEMQYDVMDVRQMTYPDQAFDLIIDKSTIDSLMCSDCPLINVGRMLQESYRVLRNGGYYLTISYSSSRLQHLVRKHINFEVRQVQLVREGENGNQAKNYLYICKKIQREKFSQEQENQFYQDLKKQEMKEYPPA